MQNQFLQEIGVNHRFASKDRINGVANRQKGHSAVAIEHAFINPEASRGRADASVRNLNHIFPLKLYLTKTKVRFYFFLNYYFLCV
jgi:hypothetical protein